MKTTLRSALLLSFFIGSLHAFAQVKREDKSKFEAAEVYMVEARYYRALPLYLQLLASEPDNANYNYKVGLCHLNSFDKLKATAFLEKAISNASKDYMEMEYGERRAPVSAYYYLAKAYHLENKFDEAIQMAEKYRQLTRYKEDIEAASKLISECKTAKELVNLPVKAEIVNLGENVNTKFGEYAPVLTLEADNLLFTTKREGNFGTINDEDGLPFEDIYLSKNVNGQWEKAVPIDSNINSIGHEASVAISADGQKIILYRESNGGDLYISELFGDKWSIPAPMGPGINTSSFEPSACFSPDGQKLFFVSNRKGGFGGKDIYVASLSSTGSWTNIRNLGPEINTKYDEDAPFMHPDGRELFFTSNGHNTMGGLDIFYSFYDKEKDKFSVSINLGYPINSTDDEAFYVLSADGRKAYFASARPGGLGDRDIYEIINEQVNTQEVALIKGIMINNANLDMSNNAIVVMNAKTGEIVNISKANSKSGKYTLALIPGDEYNLSFTVDGKEIFSEKLSLKRTDSKFQIVEHNINLPGGSNMAAADTSSDVKIIQASLNPAPKTSIAKPEPAVAEFVETDYKAIFRYNKHSFKTTEPDFENFMKNVVPALKTSKERKVIIEASASKVPTASQGNNDFLAKLRADKAKATLLQALRERGVILNPSQIELSSQVQGPEYNNDYIEKARIYEQFQYVRITVK